MLYSKDLNEALKAKNDKKALKNIALFAINEAKESIIEDNKKLSTDVKRLLSYLKDYKTISFLEYKEKLISSLDIIEETSFYDMNRIMHDIEEFNSLEDKLSDNDGELTISKEVKIKNNIFLANELLNYKVANKVASGLSKVLKKHNKGI